MPGHTLHQHGGYRFALFARRGGRVPELGDSATLEWIGRFLGRIHAVGAIEPYQQRPVLDQQSFGEEPLAYVFASGLLPRELVDVYRGVARQALDGVQRCIDRAGAVNTLRLHGDCHVGNILWTEAGPHFVDFDDSRMGRMIQDIWMLLSGSRQEQSQQLADVLAGYEDFYEFDTRELYLVEALRTLRLLHFSAGWRAAGTIRLSRRRSRGLTASAIGKNKSLPCVSKWRCWMSHRCGRCDGFGQPCRGLEVVQLFR
ncbi:serine/threonine protein kinase [Paludibacterium denitrificans]|uniref:serine/threonine protein kinase n=1 Tax=Paludibacterium denitrificans TaxID=2675226 RepID=UPI001E4DAEB4|nr:serine/threonine protein kinase [Paludibacterium denitrificans]